MTDDEEAQAAADRQALRRMVEAGESISSSGDIEFSAFAPNAAVAQEAALAANRAGYSATIFASRRTGTHSVYIRKTGIAPSPETLNAERERIDTLLKPFSMFCDGWETALPPKH